MVALSTLLPEVPTRIETDRLILRSYHAGDGPWYFRMSQRNKPHLSIFESGNAVMTIGSEKEAENVIQDFVDCWRERKAFFMAAFMKDTKEFVAQIYIGVVKWDLPEFEIGYFADVDHEGRGFVTEAVKGALNWIFTCLGAHRVRLECDETNVRSIKVAQLCGFTKEGHIRETKRNANGKYTGDVHYSLLKSEFVP